MGVKLLPSFFYHFWLLYIGYCISKYIGKNGTELNDFERGNHTTLQTIED